MKIITNAIALVVTLAAAALGVFSQHFVIAWAIMLGTFAVIKLTGQVDGYPFDWIVKAWRRNR